MPSTILVTGGTGKTGSRLVSYLANAGSAVRVASRSGQGTPEAQGVRFDWFDSSSHAEALSGIDRAYLVAPVGASEPIEVMAPFINLAIEQGVKRFVLLSSSLIERGGPAMGAVHDLLYSKAPEWAVLRPSWFMENFVNDPHLSSIRFENAIYSATDDGVVPFIAAQDIALVASKLLTNDTALNDEVVLTGPRLLSYAQVAETIGAACGRTLRHVRLTADELSTRLQSFGLPVEFAAMLAGLDVAIAHGAEARLTTAINEFGGASPMSFETFVKSQVDAWNVPT